MRFMIIRRADRDTEAGTLPSPELLNAMLKYNEEMAKAGVFLDGVGLKPSAKGNRVRFDKGKAIVTDGPFTEVKELIAGFTLIQAKTREEALEWVKRWPPEDQGVELEIRPLLEAEDFVA
ncbi:MAG: YciI family protein [Vicinamibacterales bacterium]